MKELLAKDLMTDSVISVREDENLENIYDFMSEHKIRHIPVVDAEEEVVGIISDRDLLQWVLYSDQALPIGERQELLRTMQAREIMSKSVETVTPETTAAEAGRLMMENKFSCLPIVEGNTLVGILTETDFVNHLVLTQEDLAPRPTKTKSHRIGTEIARH